MAEQPRRKLAPTLPPTRAIDFEILAAIKVALLIEAVVN